MTSKIEHATVGQSTEAARRSLSRARSLIGANPKCQRCRAEPSAVVTSRAGRRVALCRACHESPSRRVAADPLGLAKARQRLAEVELLAPPGR